MKTVVKVLLVLAVVALVVPAFAADDQKPKTRPTAYGEIVKIDKEQITLKARTDPKDKNSPTEEKTFKLAADVKVTIDGADGKLEDLKVGARCGVWVENEKVVKIGTRKPREKKPDAPK